MISYAIGHIASVVNGDVSQRNHENKRIHGVSKDSRSISAGEMYVALTGERFDGHQFLAEVEDKGVSVLLCSRSHPYTPKNDTTTVIYVDDTHTALQQLAADYRNHVNPKVIGITGSNGKTTTKDMVSAVCGGSFRVHKTEGNLNNHFGVPLTLLSMPEDTEVCIVEMGMNHSGEISVLTNIVKPDMAIITNIGEAHLEHLGSRENIAKAKLEITEGLAADGTLIHFGDEPLLHALIQGSTYKIVTFGESDTNDYVLGELHWNGESGVSFNVRGEDTQYSIPLLGIHNAINALSAIAVGDMLSIPHHVIASSLAKMVPTGMRVEVIHHPTGMLILNDAYNANPSSMKASLRLLGELPTVRRKWALLGDVFELGPDEEALHRTVGSAAASSSAGLEMLLTIGSRGRWIGEEAKRETNEKLEVLHFEQIEDCAAWLGAQQVDDVVLLMKASRGMRLERLLPLLDEPGKEAPYGA